MKKGAPLSAVGDSSALSTLWIADVASTPGATKPGDLLPAVEVRTLRSQPIAGSSVIGSHRGGRVAGNEFTPPLPAGGLGVLDEVGYIPFEPEAANLFFQLVSARYERGSLIVTSNKPFGRWGEVFGDDPVAAAMIDRLVHHAEVIALKGDSYRLKNRDLGRAPGPTDD